MLKKKLIFGVVVAQASDTEQRRIMEGIIEQAKIENIDTVVISNIYNPDKSSYNLDCDKENNIYDLIGSPDLDGIILVSESIINKDLQNRIKKSLMANPETPVVTIGTFQNDFSLPHAKSINTYDMSDIENVTDHLIQEHGFTDIDIITGSDSLEASRMRVEGYKKSLRKNGIPFDSKKVVFGDFWMTSGEKLADLYISKKRPMPQAVICTNDYMAYGMLDEFIKHDINVPEDITVIGYEHVLQRMYHVPTLTTYQRNRKTLGSEAVKMLCCRISGKVYRRSPALKGKIIPGDTCPCGTCRSEYNKEIAEVKSENLYNYFNLFSDFGQRLIECKSMNEYKIALSNYTYMIRGVNAVYLCLFEDWYSSSDEHRQPVMNCYTIHNSLNENYDTIFMNDLNISAITSKASEPCAYYFNPIFFSNQYFGYVVTVYTDPVTYDPSFRTWLRTVSNTLEMLRMKNDIRCFTQCCGLAENHDSVTDMLNKDGIELAVKNAAASMPEDGQITMLMLKTELFSDNMQFDAQEKQYLITQETAKTFKMLAVNKNEICGRISSNTYIFAGFRKYQENYSAILTDKLNSLILHASLYINEYGTNSFSCTADTFPVKDFNFEGAVMELNEKLNSEISEKTSKQSFPHYADFQKLRNKIYLNPSKQYYSDEICQKLCLSTGYFRNIYKKYFDISYHQDCIRSKISMAKYLLCTTSMSVTAIAAKCGYDDEKYFMRLFQQNTSHTPNKYRMLFQPM